MCHITTKGTKKGKNIATWNPKKLTTYALTYGTILLLAAAKKESMKKKCLFSHYILHIPIYYTKHGKDVVEKKGAGFSDLMSFLYFTKAVFFTRQKKTDPTGNFCTLFCNSGSKDSSREPRVCHFYPSPSYYYHSSSNSSLSCAPPSASSSS